MKCPACFIALLLILVSLSAQAKDPMEIIDTLYAVNSLQGTIGYHIEANMYMGGVTPNTEEGIYAGDSYDIFTECNVSLRSFLSFAIEPIPENFHIVSVEFLLSQCFCIGNSGIDYFPIWYDGVIFPCMLAHVNYGNTLEVNDFYPSEVSDIGIISDNDSIGWKQLGITNSYISDVNTGNQFCQLMLYFNILSDYDEYEDWIGFDNSHTQYQGCAPKVIVHYSEVTSNEDNQTTNASLKIYPNPVKDSFSLKCEPGSRLENVVLYNFKGQKVSTKIIPANKSDELTIKLDRKANSAGLYILKCETRKSDKKTLSTNKIILF